MILCESCGAGGDSMYETYSNDSFTWYRCAECGKMRQIRFQEPRGSRWVSGLCETDLVECSGVIEDGRPAGLLCGCHCEGGCGDPYAACTRPCPEHIPF